MSDRPAYRVSSARAMLAELERRFPDQARRLREEIPADVLASVRDALSLTWLDAEVHHQMADWIHRALGDRDYRDLWRNVFLEMVRLPLFRPMSEGAIRLFGATPASLARWTARGYTLASRGLGAMTLAVDEPDGRRVVIEVAGYPPALAASGSNVVATAGSFDGFLDLTGVQGEVTVTANEPERGFARYQIRWDARRG
jgi:hypothetical protein